MYGLIGIIIFSIALIFLVLLGVFIFNKWIEDKDGKEEEKKSIEEIVERSKKGKGC
jgi:hypothetical protein